MGLNIKNPEAHELAQKLADMTGESLTETVIQALRARLAEEEKRRGVEERVAEIKALVAQIPPGSFGDSSCDDLYDEDGLPK